MNTSSLLMRRTGKMGAQSTGPLAESLVKSAPRQVLALPGAAHETFQWPRSTVASLLRSSIQAPMFALMGAIVPTRVSGLEVFEEVDGPVLFACNHTSHMDTPSVLKALPAERRRTTVVAAAADYFFSRPLLGGFIALSFNAFSFARESCSSARASLVECGALIESGWSILIFPEGTRSMSGAIDSFKPGLGLLAVSLKVPVVPVYAHGLHEVLPKGSSLIHPGKASIRFGEPLHFGQSTHFREAAQTIEEAVRSLANEGENS